MEQNKYMVSVRCMTFNQAPYIEEALNGFTMQVTKFPYVCCIVDDASTDGEPEILRKYLQDHFELGDKTIVRKEEKNDYTLCFAQHRENRNCFFAVLWLKYNHYGSLELKFKKLDYISEWEVAAKYIALCEGDDYWIDPTKLAKQVCILEKDTRIGLVHASAKVYNQETGRFAGVCGENFNKFDDIILRNPIVTLTTCFRTSLYLSYLDKLKQWKTEGWLMGDYSLWIWLSYNSSVFFIDEYVAVYREVRGSATHKSLEKRLQFINSTKSIQQYFANIYNLSDDIKLLIDYINVKNTALAYIKYRDYLHSLKYVYKLSFNDKLFCIKRIIHYLTK